MVSDSELVAQLQEILRSSDLDTTTPSGVRRQLEQFFGVDLSDRKSFIRDQIDAFLESHLSNPQPNGDEPEPEPEPEPDEDGNEEEGEGEEEAESDGGGKRRSNKEGKVKKRGGFNKLCSLSPKLQEIVGESELSRPEVVKRMWSYIRENNLQDPNNRRNIMCNEPLRSVFRVNTINMFQMNKALTKHIWPLASEDENVKQKEMAEESDRSESVVEPSKPVKEEETVEEEEREEQEEEDNENGCKDHISRKKRKGGSSNKSRKVGKVAKKRGGGGFAKVCSLSPQLQTFTGEAQLARTEVVKRLWSYIRENKLQDPGNKQNIICDEPLRSLFNVDKINMFQMNKALTKHIWPLNSTDVTECSVPKEKQPKQEEDEEDEKEDEDEADSDEVKQEEKQPKKRGSGLLAPLPLSDALVKFFGTGENTLSRGDVVKRMWEYIKKNDLQDPSDKRRIICDEKLKELFDVDSFHGFSVSKLLTAHFVKAT